MDDYQKLKQAYSRWYRRYGPNSLRAWFTAFKKTLRCARCPESHPYCLDFHHLDPTVKSNTVPALVKKGVPKERVLAEIAKCVVLCANCHRKEHFILDEMQRTRDDAYWKAVFDAPEFRNVTQAQRQTRSENLKTKWQDPAFRADKVQQLQSYNDACKRNPALIRERGRRISEGRRRKHPSLFES
jgi:hypothetical protein